MEMIRKHTGMENKGIKQSFKDFKREAGGDKLKLDKFTKLVKQMNTNSGDVTDFAKHIFRVFDTDKDKKVTFKEVLLGFHVLSRGELDTRLRLVFSVYDVRGVGAFTPEDAKQITEAKLKMEGEKVDAKKVEDRVNACFRQCDINQDGKITLEEFLKTGEGVAEMFELEGDYE
jgi:neurocalcin delta